MFQGVPGSPGAKGDSGDSGPQVFFFFYILDFSVFHSCNSNMLNDDILSSH